MHQLSPKWRCIVHCDPIPQILQNPAAFDLNDFPIDVLNPDPVQQVALNLAPTYLHTAWCLLLFFLPSLLKLDPFFL